MNDIRQIALTFLKNNCHGVLSTVSADGRPWGSSIYFATDDDLNLFFMTKIKTFKYQNISSNNHVSLTVTDSKAQTTIQISGVVTKVPAQNLVSVIMKKLAHLKPHGDNKWVPPIVKVDGGDYVVLQITPSSMQYADYKQIKSNIYDSYIQKVI